MTATTEKRTVGSFTYDPTTSTIEGPAAYLNSAEYAEVIRKIKRGDDPCGAFHFSPDAITALLVTIQTDYAGWHGMQTFNAMRGV